MRSAMVNAGKVITFYSYKGGTGRTMALANIACLFAKQNKRVLMIDWDLEAPGLSKYFMDYLSISKEDFLAKEGLMEFIEKAERVLPEILFNDDESDVMDDFWDNLNDYIIPINLDGNTQNLMMMKAGKIDENYSSRINDFDWSAFFEKNAHFFTQFAYYLRDTYDYVLIDSRTGHTDTGGICTMLMPERLVLVFTPNEQSLEGVLNLAKKATEYRRNSNDLRPLGIYPLPSRLENAESDLKAKWKNRYNKEFTENLIDIYNFPADFSLSKYFDNVQLIHVPKYAYGEQIAVLEENGSDIYSITQGYKNLMTYFEHGYFDEEIWGEEEEDIVNTEQRQEDEKLNVYLLLPQGASSFYRPIFKMFEEQLENSVRLKFTPLEDNFDVDYKNQTALIANSDIIYIIYNESLKTNTFMSSFFTEIQEELKLKGYEIILIHLVSIDYNQIANNFLKATGRMPYDKIEKIPRYIQHDIEKRIANKKIAKLKSDFIQNITTKNAK